MSEINGDFWMTPDELAEWMKVTKDWVYDRTQDGTLPHHKFGRQLRFRYSEIQDWLKETAVGGSVQGG